MSRDTDNADEIRESLARLLAEIPEFLSQGAKNIVSLSALALEAGIGMVAGAIAFHSSDVPAFIHKCLAGDEELLTRNDSVLDAWRVYERGLRHTEIRDPFIVGEEDLCEILVDCWGYTRPLDEILEISKEGYARTLEELETLARNIDRGKTWLDSIRVQRRRPVSPADLARLYEDEVDRLRRFLYARNVVSIPPGEKLRILQTPLYLQSLRATASYSAPVTGDTTGPGTFYITPGTDDLALIATHCSYLTAHETYPGHHVLDHIRVRHPNPIRRQIESPLFYEGWACYAEALLGELGYIQDRRVRLVQLQRRLWRAVRAILDIELQTGRCSLEEGAARIEQVGFSRTRAWRQVKRFALTPGYQLCYFMGMHELLELRSRFSLMLSMQEFHDAVLGGGEIPFQWVDRRLQAAVENRQSARG
jgi:uncharacterized protein (DUF885 family)